MMTKRRLWLAAFLAAVAAITVRGIGAPGIAELEASPTDVVGAIPAAGPAAQSAATIPWARPLFSKVAVATVRNEQTIAAEAVTEGSPRLAGIILVSGRRTALIDLAGTTHRVQTGGTIGKWRIAHIDPRSVLLESGSAQEVLALDPLKAPR